MSEARKTIIFVSRLDADCSLGAYLLCDIASDLVRKYQNIEIIIVGGGSEYPKIKALARKINQKYNRRLIKCLGRTDDPGRFFTAGALLVGVSRASLEAMARGLAVILLGNEGYLGLLDEQKISRAKETNFTCRGCECSNLKSALYNDICRYFNAPDIERQMLSTLSKRTVEENYSAEKMARETLTFYEEIIFRYRKQNPPKIALCGYYGHGNFGDEIILQALLTEIKKQDPRATALVLDPQKPLISLKILRHADLFVFGGGSLLQNTTSNASLLCYMAIIHVAALLCRRKIMLANGFGPIVNRLIPREWLMGALAKAINTFDYISVRDSNSQNELKKMLPNRKIHLVADPALVKFSSIRENATKYPSSLDSTGFFVFCPHTRGLEKEQIPSKLIAKSLDLVAQKYRVQIVISVLNKNEDLELAKKLKKQLPSLKIITPKSAEDAARSFGEARFIISQRYHGALLGAVLGTPILSISNDPKMHSLCKDFALLSPSEPKLLKNAELVTERISKALTHHRYSYAKTADAVKQYTRQARTLSSALNI